MTEPNLASLLELFDAELRTFVRYRAGRLLRYETADDLVSGVHIRVLERGAGFDYRGDDAFVGWLRTVAKSYLADRVGYWTALRRKPTALLRLTGIGSDTGAPGIEPVADATGPITFAQRRERLDVAVRALDLLLPRDRRIVLLLREGYTATDLANQLELSQAAAEKARTRALDRFRRAYELLNE